MSSVEKRRWPLAAALAIVAGFTLVGAPDPAPAAEAARVLMVDNEPDLTNWHYEPAQVTVPAGSTVVWFNKGKEEHTVTADDKSFDSGYKKRGASWQRAFPRPGKYSYYCAPHPWMKGTVVVVAAAAPAPTTAAATVGDTASSTTTAPAPAVTSTTFPPSLAAPAPTTTPADTATTAPVETTAPTEEGSEEPSAAPAAARRRSGGNLAGTIAVVVLPTLGGLALGARLRRSKA
jgi:plastocyanin